MDALIAVRVIVLDEPRNPALLKLGQGFETAEVVPALDARQTEIADDRLIHRFPAFNGSNSLSKAEWACSQSHVKALESFLEDSKAEYCLILEDDAEFKLPVRTIHSRLTKVLERLGTGNFVLHCGGMEEMRFEPYFRLRSKLNSVPISWLEARVLYRAMAYVVTRHSAERLSAFLDRTPAVIADDWRDLHKSGVSIYVTGLFSHPRVLSQSALEASRHGKA